jgi:hypothetical protein
MLNQRGHGVDLSAERRAEWLAKVEKNGRELNRAPDEVKADRAVVLAALQQDGDAFYFASEALKEEREFVLAAVQKNGFALEFSSDALKAEREVVLAAVQHEGFALIYASSALKADREVVLAAFKQIGWATDASDGLSLREMMLAAVQKEGNAIHYVPEALTEDARFVLLALFRLTKEPSEKHRTETIPKLITFALALDEEAICQGIAYAARIDYPKLPERSLLAIMTITQLLLAKAVAERSKNPATADMCTALASRLQLAKYALLDQSHSRKGNIPIIGGTLSTPAGQQAIDLALRIEAKIFTMQVAVQSFAQGKWLGSFPPGESGTSRCFQDLPIWLQALLVPLNILLLLLLPLVALAPPVEAWLEQKLRYNYRREYRSLYYLSTPIVKFFLSTFLELALALTFTLVPSAALASSLTAALLLAWFASGLAWEVRQIATGGWSTYVSDRFKSLDMPAMLGGLATLASAALLTKSASDEGDSAGIEEATDGDDTTRKLHAATCLLLWLRLARVLLVSSRLGPFILMVFNMFKDVANFLVLITIVVVAFAAANFILYRPSVALPPGSWEDADHCGAAFHTFQGALMYGFESSLIIPGDYFSCVRASEQPIAGYISAMVYLVSAALLLLNMLIAMMAKTFDIVYESSTMHYVFLLLQLILSASEQPTAPPPLYLLSLPYEGYRVCRWALGYCTKAKQGGYEELKEEKRRSEVKELTEETEGKVAAAIAEYVQMHQNDEAHEERWRTMMKKDMALFKLEVMKRMDNEFKEVKEELKKANEERNEAKEELKEIKAMLCSLSGGSTSAASGFVSADERTGEGKALREDDPATRTVTSTSDECAQSV